MRKPKRLLKAEFLEHWGKMKRRRKMTPKPVPYKHTGTTFDRDGIRITGSRKFVDQGAKRTRRRQVLSNLTGLLDFENDETRLGVSYSQSTDKETGRPLDAWQCYIKVHERGDEAKMTNAFVAAISGRA